MRNILSVLLVAALGTAANAADVDPATALAAAKTQIAGKNYEGAVRQLEPAIESATKITNPDQQKQALTALHFYLAVALSGMKKDDEALGHLEEALRLTPNMRAVDASRYDARFVALFGRARGETTTDDGRADAGRFDELYPGFSPTAPVQTAGAPDVGTEPAIEILGTRQDKRQWSTTKSSSDRARLLDAFWAARDRTPGTDANEFRDVALRRIAFADSAFGAPQDRGALTDRGRVFTLLGAPALVRRRAMTAREAGQVQALSRGSLDVEVGTVEFWIYNRDQLPGRSGQPTVTFRFVSHQGVGSFVLQRDGFAINALTAAADAARGE